MSSNSAGNKALRMQSAEIPVVMAASGVATLVPKLPVAFEARLDRTTSTYECESICSTVQLWEVKAVLAAVVDAQEELATSKRLEPALALHLRRFMKVVLDPTGSALATEMGFVKTCARIVLQVSPESLLAPAAAAENTTLMLMCLDAMTDTQSARMKRAMFMPMLNEEVLAALVRLLRMAVSRFHYPVLGPWLRIWNSLYNISSLVRRVCKDKGVTDSIMSMQEASSEPMPEEVSAAALQLLRTLAGWQPRRLVGGAATASARTRLGWMAGGRSKSPVFEQRRSPHGAEAGGGSGSLYPTSPPLDADKMASTALARSATTLPALRGSTAVSPTSPLSSSKAAGATKFGFN